MYKNAKFILTCLTAMVMTAMSAPIPKEEQSLQVALEFQQRNYNGETVLLSKFKGKIIVLEWIHYDCTFVKVRYCEAKSTMLQLRQKYDADKNVVWISINSNNTATKKGNRQWAKKHNLRYVLLDFDGVVGKLYGADKNHQIFIVDTEGKIAYQGAVDNAPLGMLPEKEEYINYVDLALGQLTMGKQLTIAKTEPICCAIKYKYDEEEAESMPAN